MVRVRVKSALYLCIIFLVILGFLLLWHHLTRPYVLPFKTIRIVVSSNHIARPELKNIVVKDINGGFFALDEKPIEKQLEQLPWVKSVSIQKIWPDILQINIDEKDPVVVWQNKNLVTALGKVFTPAINTVPNFLPQLNGPDDQLKNVLQHYRDFNLDLIPLVLQVKGLTLTPRGAWDLTLSNGIRVLLGRNQVTSRFLRFIQFYPKVVGSKANKISQIDLRYPNGLAVRWSSS